MLSRFEKTLISLAFALAFAGITLVAVSAQDEVPPVAPQEETADCATCHEDTQMSWQNGPHRHAKDDPIFVNEWTEQGKPGACLTCHVTGYDEATGTWKEDGVTCAACHTDESGQHPKTTMTVDSTSGTCGTCHTDARFGLKDWEGSTHYAQGMDCSSCHDPHNASLKITINLKDPTAPRDASRLCISCHEEASMNFPYSKHSQKGITCIDCHLEHLENTNTDIHRVADHSFKASVQTCNACHADQMHTSGEAVATESVVNVSIPGSANESSPVSEIVTTPEPSPVSPVGYGLLAALIGVGAGVLSAPISGTLVSEGCDKARGG